MAGAAGGAAPAGECDAVLDEGNLVEDPDLEVVGLEIGEWAGVWEGPAPAADRLGHPPSGLTQAVVAAVSALA